MSQYCQRNEDDIIWGLLNHKQTGFYIDVGANDPIHESVTKVFSENGWHGINIEPLYDMYLKLHKDRPRDITLNCACGETNGILTLYPNGGLTTAIERFGGNNKTISVPKYTLTNLCDKYVRRSIDFLKIDVEGFEEQVIKGMDWDKYRPTVLCIECTEPNSTIPSYDKWDYILINANYKFVTDNVYNRFYINNGHL
jgi:FkbM family methyltransferase